MDKLMISATKVNEEIQNKISDEQRDNLIEKVLNICARNFKSLKEAKSILREAFVAKSLDAQPVLDINAPLKLQRKPDDYNWPALLCASWFKNTEIIKELLSLGAKPEQHLFHIIHIAVTHGDEKMCKLIFNCVPDVNTPRSEKGMTALMVAAETGNKDVAHMLIHEYHADFELTDNEGKDCFEHAKDKNRLEMVAFLNHEKLQLSLAAKSTNHNHPKRTIKI